MTRPIVHVVLLGVPCIGLAAAGCGLDTNGTLLEIDDAGTSLTGPSSNGGGSSGSGGGNSSGGVADDGSDPLHKGGGDGGDGGTSTTADGGRPSSCDFAGTWATKMTIDVSWVPQGLMGVILAPGAGKIQQWIKSVRVVSGSSTTDSTVVCGIQLPDFSGTSFVGGETYGVRFPASLLDDGFLPTTTIHGTLGDTSPHSTFVTTPSAALIGLTLANPTTAEWPASIITAVDSDMDNNPGVTVNAATGKIPDGGSNSGTYSDFPVDIFSDRGTQLFIVIRQVTQLSGAATDCDHLAGTTTIPKIPGTSTGKYAIDSHVIGCNLTAGGQCSPSQISFIDSTQPVFSPDPAGTATFTSVRIKGDATCDDVRKLLPPQ